MAAPVRKAKEWSERLGGVRLHRDDLEEIEAALRKVLPDGANVRVSGDEWRCASVEELVSREGEEPLTECEITAADFLAPHFHCDRGGVFVRVEGRDDPHQSWWMSGVLEVAQRRQSRLGRGHTWAEKHHNVRPALTAMPLLLVLLFWFLRDEMTDRLTVGLMWTATSFSVIWLGIMASGLYYLSRGSSVSLERRSDAPGFFRRNHDRLAVGTLISAFSLVTGYLLGMLTS